MIAYIRAHFAALVSTGIRALSVLAGFVITFYIGHHFGPLANGQYALVAQTAMFLSIVAVGGMDPAVVRHFSATLARKAPLSPLTWLRPIAYSLSAALLLVLALALGGNIIIAALFDRELPKDAIIILCFLLVARTLTRVTAAILRSQDCHLRAQSVEVLIIPGTVSALLVLQLLHGLVPVLWATACVGLVAAIYGLLSSARFIGRQPNAIELPMTVLYSTSLPLWATAIALNIADWYTLAIAASSLSVYDAGLFRVAVQIGGALSFVAMGIYNVFTARISVAIAGGDYARVARLCRSSTRLAMLCALPVVIALGVLADPLLHFIHPEFSQAAPLLRIVLIGQLFYVLTGPAGLVLAMTGHERVNFLISASVTGILLITAPIVVKIYGLNGLAMLAALVPLAGNVANLIAVHRLERINVITGHNFREKDARPRLR